MTNAQMRPPPLSQGGMLLAGGTPEEAVAELSVAMEAWLAAAKKAGHRLPEARYQPQHAAAE